PGAVSRSVPSTPPVELMYESRVGRPRLQTSVRFVLDTEHVFDRVPNKRSPRTRRQKPSGPDREEGEDNGQNQPAVRPAVTASRGRSRRLPPDRRGGGRRRDAAGAAGRARGAVRWHPVGDRRRAHGAGWRRPGHDRRHHAHHGDGQQLPAPRSGPAHSPGMTARGYPGAMLCPVCDAPETRVIDSRPVEGGRAIRRRRECEACGNRFTSYERLEPRIMVLKRSGVIEPFSSTKLASGISAALADRTMSGSDVEAVVAQVEEAVGALGTAQVTSEEIGKIVLEHLTRLDEVPYLRFASVYQEFRDAADFERAMAELESAE